MAKLPIEILLTIFKEMDLNHWCNVLPKVCRKWNEYIQVVWKEINAFMYNGQMWNDYAMRTKYGRKYEAYNFEMKKRFSMQ